MTSSEGSYSSLSPSHIGNRVFSFNPPNICFEICLLFAPKASNDLSPGSTASQFLIFKQDGRTEGQQGAEKKSQKNTHFGQTLGLLMLQKSGKLTS